MNSQLLPGLPNSQSEIRNSKSSKSVNSKFEIRNSKLARPLCSLTFDDGWRDNYEIAFPILRKHEVPATIFLTTDFIGTNRTFWHTRLMYVLLHGDLSNGMQIARVLQAYPAVVRHRLMGLVAMAEGPSAMDVDPVIEAVKETCNEETIEELVMDLAQTCDVRRPLFSDRTFFLEWDQVREMAGSGFEIGSHGCSHRILTRLDPEEVEKELLRSKEEIEKRIGLRINHFAFPNGNANQHLVAVAGGVGYQSASLCASAPIEIDFGRLAMRRLGISEMVSVNENGSFSKPSLLLWLCRRSRVRLA